MEADYVHFRIFRIGVVLLSLHRVLASFWEYLVSFPVDEQCTPYTLELRWKCSSSKREQLHTVETLALFLRVFFGSYLLQLFRDRRLWFAK